MVRKIAKPTFTYPCESWTTTQRQPNRQTGTQMKLLKRIGGKIGKDREKHRERN